MLIASIQSHLQCAPPGGIVTEGVPDIPDGLQKSIEKYDHIGGHSFLGWNPLDGSMLIGSKVGNISQLQILPSPGGQVVYTSSFPEGIRTGCFFPSQDLILFSADHSGNEAYQLYTLDYHTGKTVLLTDGQSKNGSVIFSPSGRQLAYRSNLRDPKHPDIYIMNPRDPNTGKILMKLDDGGWVMLDWSHDGHNILLSHLWALHLGYLWLLDANTGQTKLLTHHPEDQLAYVAGKFSPQDDGIYAISPKESDFDHLVWIPLKDSVPSPQLPNPSWEIEYLTLSPDGSLLAYLTNEWGASRLHIFNLKTGNELPLPKMPYGIITNMEWNHSGTQLGFSLTSARNPLEVFSYSTQTGQIITWTKPISNLPLETFAEPEIVQIKSFDDLPISGILYRVDPKKFPGKRPVLICIHGGPASQARPYFLGHENYYLNELGINLLFPNVRGSTGFGNKFANLDNVLKREDSVRDIGAFLDWIKTDPAFDPYRVGVSGGSYGGYMTLAVLYRYGKRVRCGSEGEGITDFVTLIRNTEKIMQDGARMEFGDERYPEMRKFLESISPLQHARDIHLPLMVTAGANDPRVPQSESDQMVHAIQAQQGTVWYLLGKNEGHGFHIASDESYRFSVEALFFQTYLLPELPHPKEPDPVPTTTQNGPPNGVD